MIPFVSLEKVVEEVDILRRENQSEYNRSDYPWESHSLFVPKEDSTDDVSKVFLVVKCLHSR